VIFFNLVASGGSIIKIYGYKEQRAAFPLLCALVRSGYPPLFTVSERFLSTICMLRESYIDTRQPIYKFKD
jgi:hypothetical protein